MCVLCLAERRFRIVGSAASGPSFVPSVCWFLRRYEREGQERIRCLRVIGDLYPWPEWFGWRPLGGGSGEEEKKIIVTHFGSSRHRCLWGALFSSPHHPRANSLGAFLFVRKVAYIFWQKMFVILSNGDGCFTIMKVSNSSLYGVATCGGMREPLSSRSSLFS